MQNLAQEAAPVRTFVEQQLGVAVSQDILDDPETREAGLESLGQAMDVIFSEQLPETVKTIQSDFKEVLAGIRKSMQAIITNTEAVCQLDVVKILDEQRTYRVQNLLSTTPALLSLTPTSVVNQIDMVYHTTQRLRDDLRMVMASLEAGADGAQPTVTVADPPLGYTVDVPNTPNAVAVSNLLADSDWIWYSGTSGSVLSVGPNYESELDRTDPNWLAKLKDAIHGNHCEEDVDKTLMVLDDLEAISKGRQWDDVVAFYENHQDTKPSFAMGLHTFMIAQTTRVLGNLKSLQQILDQVNGIYERVIALEESA